MNPADPLDLRRVVARALPRPIGGWRHQVPGAVLGDAGTQGAMLAHLRASGCLLGIDVLDDDRIAVRLRLRDGRDLVPTGTPGEALALAVREVGRG